MRRSPTSPTGSNFVGRWRHLANEMTIAVRVWALLPVDLNFLVVATGYSQGEVGVDSSVPLQDVHARVHMLPLVYVPVDRRACGRRHLVHAQRAASRMGPRENGHARASRLLSARQPRK